MALADFAIDPGFDFYGVAATYAPKQGEAVSCTVILDSKDVDLGSGLSSAILAGRVLEVRKSEAASPAKGETFTLADTGEILKVLDDPRCDDPDRLIWRMTVR